MTDASRISPQPATDQRLPANVKVLGWASFFNDVASEMIFPLLPQFLLATLGGNRFHLGLIEGLVDTLSSFVKLWAGGWSDRVQSRKPLVVVGYAIAGVARPLIALITAPWQLLGIRMGDRFGKGIRTAPRDALIADSTPPEIRGRAFGFHRGMDHLGAAVGPLLAAAFLWFYPGQLRLLFLMTLLPGLFVLALLVVGLHEKPQATQSAERVRWTLRPFDSRFRLYLLALVVFTLGNSSDAFLLVRASELGVPTVLLPVLWCGFHVFKSGGNMLAGRAVDVIGPRRMILIGWFVYAVIYVAFGLASAAWEVWVLFCGYAAFYALTEPAEKTLVANLVGKEFRGLAYGWFNCAIGIATLPASLVFGALYARFGALSAFGLGAALSLLASCILTAVSKPRPV